MKIVFLDIDGVLVNRRSFRVRDGNFPTGDALCVAALNAITEATGAEVVVTSTWRVESPLEELRSLLQKWGVQAKMIGVTPLLPDRTRGDEIRAWMRARTIERFVILDDVNDVKGMEAHLVLTNEIDGLCTVDAEKAIRILKGE